MARINISQILMKRGNTTAANTYVGPLGELVVDTGLRTVRVQDGVTPGGMSTLATNVQLQALGTYANATFGTSSYGNANVALHLLTSSIIGNINANITAANAAITSLTSNAAIQASLINAINANVTAANAAITSLTSNAAIQASLLDTLTGNAATQSTVLDTLTSNAAAQATSLTTLLSNAATQQTSLTDLVANAAIQAQAIANAAGTYGNANVEAYFGANIGTLHTNAATQATSINAITANIGSFYTYANLNYGTSSYANANVASYLTEQSITSANIGGSQTYANTQINTVSANLGAYQTFANSNAATQATSINSITANLGAYQTYGNLTFSTVANATSQAADITTLLSNAAAQATSINTVNANLGAYQTYGNLTFSTVANAATQATSIATLQTQVYANANVDTYLSSSVIGSLSTSGNLTVGGNLIVNGNTTVINTATYTIDDNILQIADGNPADSLDLGFVGHRTAGAVLQHTGLVRDASAGNWRLFSNVTAQPGATIDFTNAVYDDLVVGAISSPTVTDLYANAAVQSANIATLFSNAATQATSIATLQTQVYANANVATYLSNYDGNVRALNFVGAVQAQVGSSFAYALNAFGAGSDTGGVFLPADVNSNAVVAGYTIVSNAGVTLTVTSASFVAGTPNFINVSTSPTASSFAYPVTVYSADYVTALSNSSLTVGNATVSGNVTTQYVRISGGIISTGASPAPVISGFGSISTTGSAVNEGNITASGNLVASRGAYITGNVIAGNVATGIITVSSGIIASFSASPAPVISGFGSISTTGSAVNEGNITASGNLVASRGAYITGNVIAGNINANQYNFANGVNILSTVTAGSTYSNTNVASYLTEQSITSANIGAYYTFANANLATQTTNINTINANLGAYQTYANANLGTATTNIGALQANIGSFYTYANATYTGGGSTYSNANVASYLPTYSGNIGAGNIVTTGATSGNISGANYVSANVFQVSTGIFWANGTAWSSTGGGTTYSNANVASYLTAGNIAVGTAGFTVLPNIIAQFTGNANTYAQINTQNISSGSASTTDIVATANNGTDTIFFVDMGIAGNTYNNSSPNNSLGTIIYANDAYLYAQGNTSANVGGNLAIGTSTAGRAVTIFAGGINNSSNVATFANTGVTVYGNITAANVITSGTYGNITNANVIFANTVVGNNNNLTLSGNIIQLDAYFETYSNVVNTGGNLTLNFANTSVFYATLTANVTANIVGLANNISTVTGFTVIIDQGATPYRIANIQFNGGSTSNIKWAGTTVPTGTASNTDIISLSLINLGNGAYRVLGQQSSYG